MAGFRAGRAVTADAVSIILATIDRIKLLLNELERDGREPQGSDADLIAQLQVIPTVVDVGSSSVIAGLDTASRVHPTDNLSLPEDRAERKVANSSIRLNVDTLDHLMTMVSELALTRNQLIDIVRRYQDSEFSAPLQRLSNITAELQESVLKTRMQPIGNAWQKLPRIVRDLSAELGKPIGLEMNGAETELDRALLDMMKDPLTHMVRNAADHGLETPEQRVAAGKPERGLIRLFACHEGSHVLIEISDDGRGLDIERIRAKAIALGLGPQAEINKLAEAQVAQFIFAPGFSTADRVTNVSGRGIGMDVVRANIGKIGGTIEVSTSLGRGTVFTVKIPLTLAIVSALIIEAAGHRFAIPQTAVLEIVRVRDSSELRVEHIKDSPVLRLREKLLPLVALRSLLAIDDHRENAESGGFIVVMQIGMQSFGLAIDRVFDTEEIVVKPMSAMLRRISVFSGNTILGDGSVILILDPAGLAEAIGMPRKSQRPRSQMGDMLAPIIRAAGYAVTMVASGTEALAAVDSGQQFDCVITDIEVPGLDRGPLPLFSPSIWREPAAGLLRKRRTASLSGRGISTSHQVACTCRWRGATANP
jgi:two-component system, chemotaxis family, sensor kinase CheA